MNPFEQDPEDDWPQALSLLATGERAFKARFPMDEPAEVDWTVIIQQSGRSERVEVPVNVRGWVTMACCYVFAQWLLSGTDLLEERLDKYPTLADWAEHEPRGRRLAVDEDLAHFNVVPLSNSETLNVGVFLRYLATLELSWPTEAGQDSAAGEALEVAGLVFARLIAYVGSLTPREAWEGIGRAVQQAAEDSDHVRYQRIAYRYTREHFTEWLDTVPTAAQGAAMVDRFLQLLPTMSKDEYDAMLMWGVDPAINVPDDVWMQLRMVQEGEFEKVLDRAVETGPEDDGFGYGNFSVN